MNIYVTHYFLDFILILLCSFGCYCTCSGISMFSIFILLSSLLLVHLIPNRPLCSRCSNVYVNTSAQVSRIIDLAIFILTSI